MSSNSESPEWLENIIVLGKGVIHWSERYGSHMHCIAGIGCSGKWVRLYPLRLVDNVQLFDIVSVVIENDRPEPHRPESIGVQPESLRVVGRISDLAERLQILEEYTEPGAFLHGDGWRHQSLGLVRPIRPWFDVDGDDVYTHYECDSPQCGGHRSQVDQFVKVDRFGRKRTESAERIQTKCNRVVGGDLRFLMGTHVGYPYRWLLVTIHVLADLNELLLRARGSLNAN